MHFLKSCFGATLLAVVLSTGCAVHAGYRVYDPYHGDYHVWDDHEGTYYNQWVTENHRDHRDFRKLNKEDQKRYWDWRHTHQ
jgi:hypothetical protein